MTVNVFTGDQSGPDLINLLSVFGPVVAAAVTGLFLYISEKRRRRLDLYARAVKAVLAWEEMFFRVLRRDPEKHHDLQLRFHDIQEEIQYFKAWIATESPSVGESYKEFAENVRSQMRTPIQNAWGNEPQVGNLDPSFQLGTKEIEIATDRFMNDIQIHLGFNPFKKIKLCYRYRKTKNNER